MRADRLVSLVLLLRQRGRMTADALAAELEVSTRTVLRDIEALSTAGVPVYAERGRHGGFALLPGFRTELTGLNNDEALALLTAGSVRDGQVFGMGTALAAAMRKVVDALPAAQRATVGEVAERVLIDPEADLLARRTPPDELSAAAMAPVRRAVLAGHRLRIRYAAFESEPAWRTVDPIGMVTVREKGYLLAASDDGGDRTYRLSRILEAHELDEPARRSTDVDLRRLWAERSTAFRHGGDQLQVVMRLVAQRRDELADTALTLADEQSDPDGRLLLRAGFQDHRHAVWAMWQLGTDVEVLEPDSVRAALRDRAEQITRRYPT